MELEVYVNDLEFNNFYKCGKLRLQKLNMILMAPIELGTEQATKLLEIMTDKTFVIEIKEKK